MITLINTIEVSPLIYAKEEYELPSIADYPNPEKWYMKWEELASKLNFNFKPVKQGSYLVDIETIDDENLQMILEFKLDKIDFDDPEEVDFVMAFDGGVVLKEDDQIPIQPNCCGDMSDIQNWQDIFENHTSAWTMLWIGHPWVLYKRENGKISFSEYTESGMDDLGDIKIVAEVDECELKTELEKVIQHQINFKNRILSILKMMNYKFPEKVSKQLAGIGK
ncbi:hypothetical protein [Chryseobacterium sp.]|uniref:hypothetical protein n=1 Tax=Chryseobacterium sp. TaxID=1871047 RepID=UPI00263509ED|nr:hypothetical protein [Chryseobacterium sp.]